MDELQFRRTIYADPNCADENVKRVAKEDPKKQAFWDEIKQLNHSITQASKVTVPDDLAQRLILRQSLKSHQVKKRKSRLHLALAASVVFTAGISFTLWNQHNAVDLGQHALAHAQQEAGGYALRMNGDISLDKVNAQLASLGAEFKQQLGRIYYANFCVFNNVRSYHLVMESADGSKVTVFVVPHADKLKLNQRFSDQKMTGQMFDTHHASVIVLAENDNAVEEFKYRLKQNMLFWA